MKIKMWEVDEFLGVTNLFIKLSKTRLCFTNLQWTIIVFKYMIKVAQIPIVPMP